MKSPAGGCAFLQVEQTREGISTLSEEVVEKPYLHTYSLNVCAMKSSPGRGGTSSPHFIDAAPPQCSGDRDDSSLLIIEKLLTYETATRTQDAEFQATCAHLRPLYVTIINIGQSVKGDQYVINTTRRGSEQRKQQRKSGLFPFSGSKSTRSVASASPSEASNVYGDESKRHLGYDDIACAYKYLSDGHQDAASLDKEAAGMQTTSNIDLIKSDRQLMHILQQLSKFKSNTKTGTGTTNAKDEMTFPEFVQCYLIVVGGMQTIQHISGNGVSSAIAEGDLFRVRKRTTDRISVLVNSFGPDEHRAFVDNTAILTRTPRRLSSKKSSPSPSISKSIGGSGIIPARLFGSSIMDTSDDDMETAGELEEEIEYLRRLLAVKDKQLVKQLNDHAENVENISHEGRQRDAEILRYIRRKRRRRKRMRRMVVVFLVCVIVLCYDVGIIRVVFVNKVPRPSIHLSEFVQFFTPLSDNEINQMKQSSLEKSYRIQKLEKQQSALQAELKDVKRSLQLANEDLKQSTKEIVRLRIEIKEECEALPQSYSEYFQELLLGPFNRE